MYQATAIIKWMGNSTGIISPTSSGFEWTTRKNPLPTPAIIPEARTTDNICNFKLTRRQFLTTITCGSINVINPSRQRLFKGGRDRRRSDDCQRDVSVLLTQQLFGNCFRVGIRIGTLAHKPFNNNNKQIQIINFAFLKFNFRPTRSVTHVRTLSFLFFLKNKAKSAVHVFSYVRLASSRKIW